MAKRALIINGGTMRGAFLVGAIKTVNRMLGRDYFDAIFATSVGVFEQAFFATDQLDAMENSWKEHVTGRQLIDFAGPLQGKPILNLDYLVGLFESDKCWLDLEKLKNSKIKLLTFVAEHGTRKAKLVNLKDGPIFDIMRATSALPILYPKKVVINNQRFVDSWLLPVTVFNEFLLESLKEYEEVLVIACRKRKDKRFSGIKNIITPSKMPLWGPLDTNKERIIQTIKQGEKDTEKFIIEHNLLSRV